MRLNLGCGAWPIEGWVNIDKHVVGEGIRNGDILEMEFEDVEEVNMSHILEHLRVDDTPVVLERVRSWLRPGGKLTVEVPDMRAIMLGSAHGRFAEWEKLVYGSQDHDGEYHKTGFMVETLGDALEKAGFERIGVRTFLSQHPWRVGLPCLEAVCYVEGGEASRTGRVRTTERDESAEQPVTSGDIKG